MRFQMPKLALGASGGKSSPSVLFAMDLGSSSLKFIRLHRKGGKYAITHFGHKLLNGVAQNPSVQGLSEVVKSCMAEVGMKKGHGIASISARSTLIRHVEFPQMPLDEMKKALKVNSAPYLHQQYTNFNFDCHIIPPRPAKEGEASKAGSKLLVLVGGASTQDVLLCRDAMTEANLVPLSINLAPVAKINAFESSEPNMFQQDTVALVDIGFENSVISIVDKGQPVLTRSIPFGGSQITSHVSKTLSVDEKGAEEEKLKMSETVQVFVGSCLSVFARQIRSSMDFFERQYEVPVKRVFCCGGTALSNVILQFLTDEVGLPCNSWNPTQNFAVDLKKQKEDDLKVQAPNFAVTVGTACAMA
jgi:type IV pilus assembly protein PilM